jgi:hypothetical protein
MWEEECIFNNRAQQELEVLCRSKNRWYREVREARPHSFGIGVVGAAPFSRIISSMRDF